jgi:hypothetical protein
MDTETLKTEIRRLADTAWEALGDERRDRQILLETLIQDLNILVGPAPTVPPHVSGMNTMVILNCGFQFVTAEPMEHLVHHMESAEKVPVREYITVRGSHLVVRTSAIVVVQETTLSA